MTTTEPDPRNSPKRTHQVHLWDATPSAATTITTDDNTNKAIRHRIRHDRAGHHPHHPYNRALPGPPTVKSNRSPSMTLVQAATKSRTKRSRMPAPA